MKFKSLLLLGLALLFTGSALSADLNEVDLGQLSLKNVKMPKSDLITGGQPNPSDLALLAKQGVKMVINLRSQGEFDGFDEAAAVSSLGMEYQQLEISGRSDVTKANAVALDKLLSQAKGPVLLHCASGNRVGALLALRAYYVEGQSPQQALAFGKTAGLTKLANQVGSLLAEPAANKADKQQ